VDCFYVKWALICVKRNIRRIAFWLLIFVCAFSLMLVISINRNRSGEKRVMIYNEGSMLGEEVIDNLLKSPYEGYLFEMTDSEEGAVNEVTEGKALCAVVIRDFSDTGKSSSDSIVIYEADGTTEGYLIKELIYPNLLEAISPYLMRDYLEQNGIEENSDAGKFIVHKSVSINEARKINIFTMSGMGEEGQGKKNADSDLNKKNEDEGKSYVSLFAKAASFVIILSVTLTIIISLRRDLHEVKNCVCKRKRRVMAILQTLVYLIMVYGISGGLVGIFYMIAR